VAAVRDPTSGRVEHSQAARWLAVQLQHSCTTTRDRFPVAVVKVGQVLVTSLVLCRQRGRALAAAVSNVRKDQAKAVEESSVPDDQAKAAEGFVPSDQGRAAAVNNVRADLATEAMDFGPIVPVIVRTVPAKAAVVNSGDPGIDLIEFQTGTSGAAGGTIITTMCGTTGTTIGTTTGTTATTGSTTIGGITTTGITRTILVSTTGLTPRGRR
jgi:hypothetical protein